MIDSILYFIFFYFSPCVHSRCRLRSIQSCSPPKCHKIGKGVPTQSVSAMQSRCRLPCGIQSWNSRLLGLRIHLNAPHHIVCCRPYFHRLLCYVDSCKLLELMIHPRQFLPNLISRPPRYIQIRPPMLTCTACCLFAVNCLGNYIARQKFWRSSVRSLFVRYYFFNPCQSLFFSICKLLPEHLRDIVEHETISF